MEKNTEVYETPMVIEAGDFADVTLGQTAGALADGGTPPNAFRPNF
ncbi:lasso RiPP family leader peptide-containing protein [Streptomyces chrestomyceticus]